MKERTLGLFRIVINPTILPQVLFFQVNFQNNEIWRSTMFHWINGGKTQKKKTLGIAELIVVGSLGQVTISMKTSKEPFFKDWKKNQKELCVFHLEHSWEQIPLAHSRDDICGLLRCRNRRSGLRPFCANDICEKRPEGRANLSHHFWNWK
jgi:hypothetical protein